MPVNGSTSVRHAPCLLAAALLIGALAPFFSASARACPFCSAIANTISDDLEKADVAVAAEWLESRTNRTALARNRDGDEEESIALRDFQAIRVYKGKDLLEPGIKRIQTTFRGHPAADQVYLIFGFGKEPVSWSTAQPIQRGSLVYLDALSTLPAPGPQRLRHFLSYLNHPERALADDAYNEFARAPYTDVKQLRPYLDRQWLLQRLQEPQTDDRRRRLYLTLLGVCGEPQDAAIVLQMIHQLEAPDQTGIDAAVACYLTLTRSQGLAEIERRFFRNPQVAYKNVHAAIAAIRFHGEEEQLISKSELCGLLRAAVPNPQLAVLVIPDLARWEDWSARESIIELFRKAEGKQRFARVPAARYLMACPDPAAKKALQELEKLDADSVRQAKFFIPIPPRDAADDVDSTEN